LIGDRAYDRYDPNLPCYRIRERMTGVDLDDWRWLIGGEAEARLAEAAAIDDPLARVARLRKSLSVPRAALVAEQAALRRKARVKFRAAERMFFTAVALEQATDDLTAAYKAARFAPGTLVDACCGIGGDLIALARRGPVAGIERDPIRALVCEANLRATADPTSGGLRTAVLAEEVEPRHVAEAAGWHIDPDRRATGRRTTRIESHEPSLETLEALLAANPNGAVKLAPGADPPAEWRERAELEWISRGGECRQLVAWFGSPAADAGRRRATVVAEDGTAHSLVGLPDASTSAADEIGRYMFDCDAAVLAAGLVAATAARWNLRTVHAGSVYLTGDHLIKNDPALRCFEVLDTLPLDVRQVRGLLEARGIGRLEIKKRGVDVDVEKLRRALAMRGEAEGCLILARRGDRVTAVLTRRV
jgi:hypothetical protein